MSLDSPMLAETGADVPLMELRAVRAAYGPIEVLHGVDIEVPVGTYSVSVAPLSLHVTPASQGNVPVTANGTATVDFAYRRFGEITGAHPTVPSLPGHPNILDLNYTDTDARANNWHTDVTFVDRPPLGSVLNALVIPPAGGDTLWSNSDLSRWPPCGHYPSFAEGSVTQKVVKCSRVRFRTEQRETMRSRVLTHRRLPESQHQTPDR